MKRCPQCEFIYEDEQSICDMDGVLLVFDARTLPNLHALATVSAPMPEKTSRRNRMVPAFATLILMLAVASVYYVSTMRNAAQNNLAPTSVTTTTVQPDPFAETPLVVPAPSPEAPVVVPAPSPEANVANEVQPRSEPKPKPAVAAPTTAKSVGTKPVPAKPEPKKEDSKVESILKKTGKLLKKPFKF